jgi:hypothetical protein
MSGLSHHPGKVAQGQPCRGFESLPLRHSYPNQIPFIPSEILRFFSSRDGCL